MSCPKEWQMAVFGTKNKGQFFFLKFLDLDVATSLYLRMRFLMPANRTMMWGDIQYYKNQPPKNIAYGVVESYSLLLYIYIYALLYSKFFLHYKTNFASFLPCME